MRLDVGVYRAEEFLGAVDGELLHFVRVFAAAVVASSRIAFGVLVGKNPPHRFENRFGDKVLRGNEFESSGLALGFVAEEIGDLRVDGIQGPIHALVGVCVLTIRNSSIARSICWKGWG